MYKYFEVDSMAFAEHTGYTVPVGTFKPPKVKRK